jgi:hypothetical protein
MTPRRGMRLAGCVYNSKTAALKSSAAVYKLRHCKLSCDGLAPAISLYWVVMNPFISSFTI